MQETPVCDIIHYEDARWRPLVPGEHVLAPVDAKMEHYGPGTVLQGTETRARGLGIIISANVILHLRCKVRLTQANLLPITSVD